MLALVEVVPTYHDIRSTYFILQNRKQLGANDPDCANRRSKALVLSKNAALSSPGGTGLMSAEM